MEVPVIRQPRGHLGSEKHQMLELNKRLETYLGRVKFLEEENEFLREEIQALQRRKDPRAWKRELEDELRKARGAVEVAWMERDRVELEVGNLCEELQALGLQRQKEAASQAEARKTLGESKKQLEEEKRAQIWLRERASQLEKELQHHQESHQEEVSVLQARLSQAQPILRAAPCTEVPDLQDLTNGYSQMAAQAWQEAADAYQDQVRRLEESLTQARSHIAQVTQEKREGYLTLQRMAKELDAARNKKGILEQNITRQQTREHKKLQEFQAHLDSLENEKVALGDQISVILEDRRNLLQLKMSLGLEVATYRALLDNESLRVNNPSINYSLGSSMQDGGFSPRQRLHTMINGHHISSPVSIKPQQRTQATAVATAVTPLRTPPQDARMHNSQNAAFTGAKQAAWSVESSHSVWSTPYSKNKLNGKDLTIHCRTKEVHEVVDQAVSLSVPGSRELGTITALKEECDIDQLARGNTDVNVEETVEQEQDSTTTEPDKHIILTSSKPIVDQEANMPAEFQDEFKEQDSPAVTLDLSEADNPEEPNDSSEDCKDMGAEVPSGRVTASLSAPLFAWGEKEEVKEQEEMGWNLGKACEFESESDVRDMERTPDFGSVGQYSSPSGQKLGEQVSVESELSMSLNATIQLEEVLSQEEKKQGGEGHGNVSVMEDKNDGDYHYNKCEPEELMKDELAQEEDSIYAHDGENECTTKADIDRNEAMDDENKTEQREEIGKVKECSETEQNETEVETKEVMSAEEGPIRFQTDADEQHGQTPSEAEQLDFSEEEGDVSQNTSHSWRTDGGEMSNDSYTLENTLADTRPLIRYKSDEADMNTQASHLGNSDSSDDEASDGKGVGTAIWGEEKRRVITSKSVEFMDDLDEESERDAVTEEAAEEPLPSPAGEKMTFTNDEDDGSEKVVEEGIASLEFLHMAGPTESMVESMIYSREEENDGMLQERDLLSLNSNDGLKDETVDSETALGLPTECHDSEREETETPQPTDPVNSNNDMSSQSHSHMEEEATIRSTAQTLAATSLSLPSELDESFNQSAKGSEEAARTEQTEVLDDRREEEEQNLSMLTNVDFTDELSLRSEPGSTVGSLANTANSDLDESYSSEDDSPNASQVSQPIKQEAESTNQGDLVGGMILNKLSEEMGESAGHSSEISDPLPENETEEVADPRDVFLQDQWEVLGSSSSKAWGTESFVESAENIAKCAQMLPLNEGEVATDHFAEEEWKVAAQPSGGSPNADEESIFKVKETEVAPQTNGKCNDLNNLLSTAIQEHAWGSSKKAGAAYDPAEHEQYDHVTMHTNQNLAFGDAWGNTENLFGSSEHTEGGMVMTEAPSLEEQRQIPVQVKQLLGGKMEEEDGINSDDSLDEGDSWSSGEE